MHTNKVLITLAQLITTHKEEIVATNARDLATCTTTDIALVDRLKLTPSKVDAMVKAVETIIAADSPVDKLLYSHLHQNGLTIQNKTVPFGTILIIYESRPDVTIEASILAYKAGNKIILKGGKEARLTNLLLVQLWQKALQQNGENCNDVIYLDVSREKIQHIIKYNTHHLDLIIPRGGDTLIAFVQNNTTIPTIVSGRGNNFLYVHNDAAVAMATSIILNGKARVSVCNALDKILVNDALPNAQQYIAELITVLTDANIEVWSSEKIAALHPTVHISKDITILQEEFLAAKIYIDTVATMDNAIHIINDNSGGHSASIITTSNEAAQHFMQKVDCAAVYHNASTRFTDGGELGFGAEMAISTQKLHFRGPIGLAQLVTNKWFVTGNGQVRN